jgi:serine/threonine-protein kinase
MARREKQTIEIEKTHRNPLPSFHQAVTPNYSDFLGTALGSYIKYEKSPLAVGAGSAGTGPHKESHINIGDQLDHYRIDSVVARGNVATVYRGTDPRTGRPVALKIPHPDMEGDQEFFERFEREQEIGKTLDHPGVMKVIADDHRTGKYMVMEWADGKLLSQMLKEEKKLSPERAVKIAIGIAHALGYIHNHGIVHRSLNPKHIMVDAQDHVKLIHFGVAAKTGARRITFTKLPAGMDAPQYASPEQVAGKRDDARSDLYALGVILYEMVTGQSPFRGSDAFSILNDRLMNHPAPPREIDPAISPQLQEVIYRAMEREAQNRYANAHDFAADLEHLDKVGIADRCELRDWKKRRTPATRKVLLYFAVILVPLLIFALLLYFSRR